MLTLEQWALAVLFVLLLLDIAAIATILWIKYKHSWEFFQNKWIKAFLISDIEKTPLNHTVNLFKKPSSHRILLNQFISMRQSIRLRPKLEQKVYLLFDYYKITEKQVRRLNHLYTFQRIDAAVCLGHINTSLARSSLEQRLLIEKKWLVKMYIVNALSDIAHPESVLTIINTIQDEDAPDWYVNRTIHFLTDFGKALHEHMGILTKCKKNQIRMLIIKFAQIYAAEDLKNYCLEALFDSDIEIVTAAATSLSVQYPLNLDVSFCLKHNNSEIRQAAINAMSINQSKQNIQQLIYYTTDKEVGYHAVNSLTAIISKHPNLIDFLVQQFLNNDTSEQKQHIIEVLSHKAEFFILQLLSEDKDEAQAILKAMIEAGFINSILGFFARNKNIELENSLILTIKSTFNNKDTLQKTFSHLLDDRLLKKMGLTPQKIVEENKCHSQPIVNRLFLSSMIAAALLVFPLMFVVLRFSHFSDFSLSQILQRYILDCNFYMIFYTFSISSLYLILLFISALDSIRQRKYASVKKNTFLFRTNLLPSISIIAPAFNEELTVVESANSLLNIHYPDFEVLIVNDGSNDNTLRTLIEYFNLEKVDMVIPEYIKTNPVRAIYRCSAHPRLTVIDKVNGGKADSLNAGINLSRGEYFCGIDADSLLEEDALLKIVSTSLDVGYETVAAGGNIFPINGCIVKRGVLETIGTPKNALANFQFVEYIRAFMAGRIGWAKLNCLLIISGAFGLFRKKRVIECGGYLTCRGQYKKNTVGEDMELVVRLNKHMHLKHLPYKITYSYNANCWTEVPENIKTLLRQRDRWHRGLIEILTFHRDMFFNKRFGRIGLIATPYFYFFEMMGPIIEANGYLLIILSALLGIINRPIILLLFTASVMMGIFISIASLIIAEQEVSYFKAKEVFKLIAYAIIENFGFRQFISLWRVLAFVNIIKGNSEWGKMERTGFAGAKK